jgi:PLD-like domain
MTKIQSHFDRKIQDQVREVLNAAKYSIRVAMYNFNDNSLFDTICYKAEQGIEVEILLDSESKSERKTNEYLLKELSERLLNAGGSIFIYDNTSGRQSIMHNKFCIVDDRIFLTGSYNWTNNAAKYSNENIVIVEDFLATYEYTKKFNQLKHHSTLYTENIDLPIYFSTSKNVVKRNEEVEISWRVPNTDTITFNGEKVLNIGTATVIIYENRKFRLSALNENSASVKTISVTIAEKPEITTFKVSEKIVRRGQSVKISWEIKGASKIKIEPFGEVTAVGMIEHIPQTDTIYKLIAFDVWGDESVKELSVRVPDFKVPSFENIQIIVPQLHSIVSVEVKKPIFSQNLTSQTLSEILKKQEKLTVERNYQLRQIRNNQKTSYKGLKESIKEKSTQIRFNRIKEAVIDRTENVLNQLLAKLRESR